MKHSYDFSYPFKVWATILVGGPLLGILLNIARRPDSIDVEYLFGAPPLLALLGAFTSTPAFIIYYIAYRLLRGKVPSELLLKLSLCIISLIGAIGTIYFFVSDVMLQPSNRDGFLLTLGYVIMTVPAGLFYKLLKKDRANAVLTRSS